MIGAWSQHADLFLIALAAITFIGFTLPLLFVPLAWARIMGFAIPTHSHLAVYFGRSVGGLAGAANFMAARAAFMDEGEATVIAFIAAVAVLMTLIHAWGAYRKIQPLSESLETFFWIAIGLIALAVYPG